MKIIPNLVWDKQAPFPMNNTWGYHDAATGNGRYDKYYEAMVKRFGPPESMEEFSDKMQLMNAMGYQGIFEAAQHKLNENGGIMLWKLNAAFPSVIWQIYDWFLQPNAGYYFMQGACEPLHIQLNLNDSSVAVLNRKHHAVKGLTAEAKAYTLKSEQVFRQTSTLDIGAEEITKAISMSTFLNKAMGVTFIVLQLKDASGNVVSRNTYWLEKNKDFRMLQQMPKSMVSARLISADTLNSQLSYTFKLTNTSRQLAFFVRTQMMNNKEEILPSFWSANYVTLAPGESVTLTATIPKIMTQGIQPVLRFSGWNLEAKTVDGF